jgi:hypothetical protein
LNKLPNNIGNLVEYDRTNFAEVNIKVHLGTGTIQTHRIPNKKQSCPSNHEEKNSARYGFLFAQKRLDSFVKQRNDELQTKPSELTGINFAQKRPTANLPLAYCILPTSHRHLPTCPLST